MTHVALVIGEADNLCEAICTRLSASQYLTIFLTDLESHSQDKYPDRTIEGIRDLRTVACNIENDDEIIRQVRSVEREAGQIDILILAFTQGSSTQSRFPAARYISEGMAARDYGRIVAIDSSSLEKDQDKKSPKWQMGQINSVREFVQTLVVEITNSNVTLNTITAGRTESAAITSAEEVRLTETAAQSSTGYLTQQQEIAGLVAYLVSDEAAFISGANIVINAGRYLN